MAVQAQVSPLITERRNSTIARTCACLAAGYHHIACPRGLQGRVHPLAARRQLHYAREGKITRRQPEQQNEQAWCLTVVTNAVICWHTEYMGLAVDQLREAGREATPRSWRTSPRPAARP
ncbi:Tn3 family transposase [Streptomyces sp. NPDC046197]|uniref:Tn3 family transposase n=1 Tax=Streptomyces sp. NPDC046197 TaxID=3154337 RepID=UPI0033D3D58F